MTWDRAIGGCGWPFSHGNPALNELCGAAAAAPAQPALALGARQIAAPAVVLGASNLGVDEAIDALVANHPATSLACEPTGDLLGRPTTGKVLKNGAAQGGLAFEAGGPPAPRPSLLFWINPPFVKPSFAHLPAFTRRR